MSATRFRPTEDSTATFVLPRGTGRVVYGSVIVVTPSATIGHYHFSEIAKVHSTLKHDQLSNSILLMGTHPYNMQHNLYLPPTHVIHYIYLM